MEVITLLEALKYGMIGLLFVSIYLIYKLGEGFKDIAKNELKHLNHSLSELNNKINDLKVSIERLTAIIEQKVK